MGCRQDNGREADALVVSGIPHEEIVRSSEGSLPFAEHLARGFQANIFLVQVVPTKDVLPPIVARLVAPEDRLIADNAEKYLSRIGRGVTAEGLSVQHRVLQGATVPQLVQFISQEAVPSITLLCVRGESGYTPYILGSTSLSLLRSSGGPFLLIPPSHEILRL